jgi:hypothetical protein
MPLPAAKTYAPAVNDNTVRALLHAFHDDVLDYTAEYTCLSSAFASASREQEAMSYEDADVARRYRWEVVFVLHGVHHSVAVPSPVAAG